MNQIELKLFLQIVLH